MTNFTNEKGPKGMKDTDLRRRRDRDLYEAYVEGLRSGKMMTRQEAVDYARLHSAPRFYISGDYCRLIMGRKLAGLPTGCRNILSAKKFDDLWELFKREMDKGGRTVEEVSERIVEMPAPSFYITWGCADKIIQKERKKAWERLLARL